MNSNESRVQFEAWAVAQSFRASNIDTTRDPAAREWYVSDLAALTWRAWQAALAARQPGAQDQREGCAGSMTDDRVAFFLRRFRREENLLGPHEQWAMDVAISRFEQQDTPPAQVPYGWVVTGPYGSMFLPLAARETMEVCAKYMTVVPVYATPTAQVPDCVWEALQRIIENSALHGPASNEDAVLVARYRRHLLAAPPAQGIDLGQLERFDMEGVPTSRGLDVRNNLCADGEWVRFDDVKALVDGQRGAAGVPDA